MFVTGLSAGGAMAAVLLASYPEAFAGGGIIAGLPFGIAHSVPQAFDRMRGHGGPAAKALPSSCARSIRSLWPVAQAVDLARERRHDCQSEQRAGPHRPMGSSARGCSNRRRGPTRLPAIRIAYGAIPLGK